MVLWVGDLGWAYLDGSLSVFDGLIHVSLAIVAGQLCFMVAGSMRVCVYLCV